MQNQVSYNEVIENKFQHGLALLIKQQAGGQATVYMCQI